MATKIGLWNSALREIGHVKLSDTGEAVEAGFVLTDVHSDVLAECLEAGQWNFAIRAIKVDSDTGIATNFGFGQVFDKPDDWVRTVGLSSDEYFNNPLTEQEYSDEIGIWLADTTPIYVRYVSDDSSYGGNLSGWPASYARYVELELALRISERLTQNASKQEVLGRNRTKAKRNAMNKDAMNEGTRFPPQGSWVRSRSGRTTSRERGSRTSLTG